MKRCKYLSIVSLMEPDLQIYKYVFSDIAKCKPTASDGIRIIEIVTPFKNMMSVMGCVVISGRLLLDSSCPISYMFLSFTKEQ